MRTKRRRHHDEVRAGSVRTDVERETGPADARGEQRAETEITAELAAVDTDGAQRFARSMQQVHDKQHRNNAGGNAEQLVGEVEPGPVASDRSVQYRVLGRERDVFDGEVVDQIEQGTDATRAE